MVKEMAVKAAGQSGTFTWNTASGNDAQNGDWQQDAWSFTADGPTAKVEFESLDPNKGKALCGPVVAAISVTQTSGS